MLFLKRACIAFVLLTGKSLRLRMSTTSHYGDEIAKKGVTRQLSNGATEATAVRTTHNLCRWRRGAIGKGDGGDGLGRSENVHLGFDRSRVSVHG